MSRTVSILFLLMLASFIIFGAGCVRRTIQITSDPAGALVYLNHQEIGRTPVEVDFRYYGDYDVRLVLEGYEPLLTVGRARAPLWDHVPVDLVAEMVPGEPHSRIHWHYDLQPEPDAALGMFDRAVELRSRLRERLPEPPVVSVEQPASETEVDEDEPDDDEIEENRASIRACEPRSVGI